MSATAKPSRALGKSMKLNALIETSLGDLPFLGQELE
jgi:hypothetical protein